MKKFTNYLCTALVLSVMAGCGGEGDDGTGGGINDNVLVPASVVGTSITYTVTNAGTAGIPIGYKIKWTFSNGGVISGVNPVTGQKVTPSSYTYTASGGKGYVDVRYVQGTQKAYEIYTMTGETKTTGKYTYEGNTGTGVKTAAGTYSVP